MKLTREEAAELIARYQSELRKLAVQQEQIKGLIDDLEQQTQSSTQKRSSKKSSTSTGKRRGRPPKAKTAEKAAPKRRGRPPKAKTAEKAAPKRRGRPPKAKTAEKAAPKRRGRPPKAKTAEKAAPKRRGRPPKSASTESKSTKTSKRKGYRLSEWDQLVMDTLNKRQKVSVFSDFLEEASSAYKDVDEKALYRRINQSLHKLANKRGDLLKVPRKGRGYGYALPEWKSGRGIKKEFQ